MKIPAFFRCVALLCAAVLPLAAQQRGLTSRPDVEAYYDGTFPTTAPAVPGDWSTVIAFPNLIFQNPVGLTAIPGTNQIIVWERDGKIWSFPNDPATTEKTLVIDLSANTQGWDDSGMLGLALHPDFQNNRQMWIWYNWRGGITGASGDMGPVLGNANTRPPTSTPTRNRLSRFVLDANYQTTQSGEYVVIDQQDASVWHNGGGMFFHPENGFLYITNGDDQNSGLNTQRIDRALFSCVIRIDVDLRGGTISHAPTKRPLNEVSPTWPRYYVPNDNPFVGQPTALEEIYALGLRSPHRMTIDPVTGRIFIGDVGASSREEISVIEPNDPPGLNFQWDRIEGKNGNLTGTYIGTSKPPIIDYAHAAGDGSCVVGGYVYRGTEFPELYGKYIFGDNMSGIIWYLDESVTPAVKVRLATLPDGPGPNSGNDYRGLGSFGVDANGELFICRLSSVEGRIYKLQRGGPPPGSPLPATLGATGLFSNLASLTPDSRLIPYQLNAPFWSDNAIKSRFVAIPNGSTVGFSPTGQWNFPSGTVLVKHFDLPVSDIDPNAKRRLETRVIVKQDDGEVYGATYKWRADQSDADLLDGALTENVSIATAPVGSFTSQDIGNPTLPGSTVRDGNQITITAGGTDIWGNSDQFHFAHQQRTGDFDVSVRIESVVQSDLYTKTGLMVRDSLAANARHVMALVFPSNAARNNNTGGYEFQYRATTGGGATALYPAAPQPLVNYPNTWLRMKREGDTFIAYWSADGFTWAEYSRTTLDLPDQLYFGLAVTAHTGAASTVAKFHVDTRRQPWYFPSRQDCMRCHNPQAGGILGPSTRQFNRAMLFPNGVTDEQLGAWNHVGLFDDGPEDEELAALEKLHHHNDTSASLLDRARSYLDANCSYCHQPNGVQALWDGRSETSFQNQGIYYGPLVSQLGDPDARVVVPKNLASSMLHHRVSITGANQMPPLARNLVDKDGVAMLEAWIASLPEETVLPPAVLVATAVSNTQVDLSWQDLSENEAGFSIERSLDGVNFTSLAIVGPGITGYSDITAEPFQVNSYRVMAFGEYVYSTPSNIASATANVGPPAPEIHLTGNGVAISNNDLVPDAADGTDFGVFTPGSGNVTRTFTIRNLGNLPLSLTGNPRVRIEGPDAASFTVVSQPPASLDGPGSFDVQILFAPQGYGSRSATVVIASDDASEPVTTFAIQGVALDDGIVAWWRLDEGSGGMAMDATGFGRNGTLTEPLPQWQETGKIGGSLRFTGEFNQSVMVENHPSLNPTTAITISAWVNAADWTSNRRVLQKGNTDSQYRLLVEAGELVWDIANVGRLETTLPPVNQWVHVAATYDGARMRAFINGVRVGTMNATGAIPVTADPLYLGTKIPTAIAGDHLNGALDDVRLYNRSLTGSEIGALAGLGLTDGLAGWWKFDEANGTAASDSSGAGNNGTLTAPLPQWQATGGRLAGALRFSGEVGQSVTVPNATSLNPTAGVSVSAWVNAVAWNGNNRILQKGSNDNQYRLMAEFGEFAWDISGVGRVVAPLPPANQWVHIAATYDGNRMVIYYDGVEVAMGAATAAVPVTNNALHLGTKTAASGAVNHLNGMLDQVRLYRRGLSAAEVAQLALEGNTVSIAASDATARKGTGDTGLFTVTRTGPTAAALDIPLLQSGTAMGGLDFTLNPVLSGFAIPAGQSSANLLVQPVDSTSVTGPVILTLSLGEVPGYLPGSASASVTIQDSPVNDWKISAFGGLAGAQGADASDDADADGDGLTTLMEAALGGSPSASDTGRLPVEEIELVDGQLFLTSTYVRPRPALASISYVHRSSLDLTQWDAAVMVAGYPVDNGNGTETVKTRTAVPIGGQPKQFLRLEITRP
ncbi:PQQ-dependent sugar dehydrogenase [Luteolibacter flavescens]|uniref:PQQ-dependent sugar dehydrogenase n=1 Tax=Luteolibacter flavescens TaxID=1859460 RepID=A0ABT3FUD9_9BACT|nr:LamG-like jellyroll fold domain-containing protein [Luteolibacter flavescens]MCW1886836.1 PQQ-dependent sugar dehydrogenase [Luteolibacter flavescens]